MASLQTSLQTLIRTPMLDASGLITREWTLFMQQLIKSLNVTDDLQAQVGYILDSTSSGINAFRSLAYQNSAGTSLPNNVFTPLSFDTNAFDVGGIHSTSVNPTRFTAPVGGLYLVQGTFQAVSGAAGIAAIDLQLNGSTTLLPHIVINIVPLNANGATPFCSTIVQLAANDYLEFFGKQTSGGTLVTITTVTWASMTLLYQP
jgi:hypothetical protein